MAIRIWLLKQALDQNTRVRDIMFLSLARVSRNTKYRMLSQATNQKRVNNSESYTSSERYIPAEMYLSDLMCQVLSRKSLFFSLDGVWIVKRVSIFISWSLSDFPLRTTRFVSDSIAPRGFLSRRGVEFRGNRRCKSSASDPNKNAEIASEMKNIQIGFISRTLLWLMRNDNIERRLLSDRETPKARAAKRIDGLWVIFDTSMGKQTTNNKLCSVKWIQIQRQS